MANTDIVVISCPYCGGKMERQRNEYFAKCPYCGREVCFDEIKEEAELGSYREKIVELQHHNNALERDKIEEDKAREKLRVWEKTRNKFMTFMTVMHGLGFGLISSVDAESEGIIGIGIVLMIIAWATLILIIIVFPISYPDYNYLTGKREPADKWKLFFKMLVISVSLCLLSLLVAFLVLLAMGKTGG